MTQELHYTSVPRGLRPGSQGFCTVACTPRMPGPMVDWLEGLSGYQPLYPVHDPSASRNPINLSHLRPTIGGRVVSVLSRVGPAGLDYSGRSNKYAHHVVLEANERPPGGPAWLVGQPGFMQAAWEGEPRDLPEGRKPPQGDRPAGIAAAWQALAGDAGWAGVLAESFLADPRRPAILVFRPGMDLLPLFAEAIALLPPSRRWEVEFSTYFTTPQRGMAPLWRAMIEGTPETESALRLPNALVVNLCGPSRRAEGGALVHQARTGERRETRDPDSSASSSRSPRPRAATAAGPTPPGRPPGLGARAGDLIPGMPNPMADGGIRLRDERGPAPRSTNWVLIGGIVAACLIPLAALGFLLRGIAARPPESGPETLPPATQADRVAEEKPKPKPEVVATATPPKDRAAETKPEIPAHPAEPGHGDLAPTPAEAQKPPSPGRVIAATGSDATGVPDPQPDRPEHPVKPAKEPSKPATEPPRSLIAFFPLKEPGQALSEPDAPSSFSLKGFNLGDAEIKLRGAGPGLHAESPKKPDGGKKLIVSTSLPDGSPPGSGKGGPVATFRLSPEDHKVELSWEQGSTSQTREQLRDCVLVLTSKQPAEERSIILRGEPRLRKDGLKLDRLATASRSAYDLTWDFEKMFSATKRTLRIEDCRVLDTTGQKVIDVSEQADGSWQDKDSLLTVKFAQNALLQAILKDAPRAIAKKRTNRSRSFDQVEGVSPSGEDEKPAAAAEDARRRELDEYKKRLDEIHSARIHVVITWEVDGTRFRIARSPGIAADRDAEPSAH